MRSIQILLISLMLGILIVTVAVLTTVNLQKTEEVITRGVEENLTNTTKLAANGVDAFLQQRKTEVETIANSPVLANGDKEAIFKYLNDELKRMPIYGTMWIGDAQGIWYAPNGTSGSSMERPYYKEMLATHTTVIADPMIGGADGKMAVVIVVPFFQDGKLVRYFGGNIKIDQMVNMVSSTKLGQLGAASLYHFNGTVIADKDPGKILKYNVLQDKDSVLINVMKSIQKGETGIQFIQEGGKKEYVAYAPLKSAKWAIASTAIVDEFMDSLSSLRRWALGSAMIIIVLSLIAVFFFARRITHPIKQMQRAAEVLAEGDCTIALNVYNNNEIGGLADSFRKMTVNLRQLIGDTMQSSSHVAASADQLAESSKQSAQATSQIAESINKVAHGASVQTSAMEKAMSVVERISANLQEVAANSQSVAGDTDKTLDAAQQGGKAVHAAVNQMENISSAVVKSAQAVKRLGDRSKEIGEIVETISGIAGQTNLLALNAAIEAARAGHNGRGFVVVAEEVRKLAEQSQEAAGKIAELIKGVQNDTSEAVISMEQGSREVNLGIEVVNSSGNAFEKIIGLIEHVSHKAREISTTTENVASGSQQLVSSVHEIDVISKETASHTESISAATEEQAASMEEIAASSQELSEMAEKLKDAISKFKV